jgi:trimeric autotransporter adhesin
MKKITLLLLFTSLVTASTLAQNTFPATGSVGIGTNTPNAASLLEVKSTTKGILIPRMTITQRNAIVSPVVGLMIFQTNSTPGLYYYSGTAWTAVSPLAGANRNLSNLLSPIAFNTNLTPDSNNKRNLGTTTLTWHNGFFGGTLKIGAYTLPSTDGTNGQVLTTNGTGNVSWKTVSGGGGGGSQWTTSGSNIFYNAGNVGIGTATPAYKLDVAGDINLSTGSILREHGRPILKVDTVFQNVFLGTISPTNGGTDNTTEGDFTFASNTSGHDNVANGWFALFSNSEGARNIAIGSEAMLSNSTGNDNTAIGQGALFGNTIGQDNTAEGSSALVFNSNGAFNTAVGYEANAEDNGTNNNGADGNTAVGYTALIVNNSSFNTACGFQTLAQTTTSEFNTALGYNAGAFNNLGFNNVFLGANTGTNADGLFNDIAIGQDVVCTASSNARIGNSSTVSIGGFVGWTNFSDVRYKKNIKSDVPGLAFINLLKPITYNLDVNAIEAKLHANDKSTKTPDGKIAPDPMDNPQMKQALLEKSQIVYTGFAAQDVEKAAESLNYDFSGVDKPKDDQASFYGLRYGDFVVPLVKAVQELSAEVDALKAQLANSTTTGMVSVNISNADQATLLGQNIPNPFDHTTLIPFRIPSDCHDASIAIVETATGKIIHLIPVSCTETELSFDAGSLASGNYSYSLYVDGKLVETKQMVLNK